VCEADNFTTFTCRLSKIWQPQTCRNLGVCPDLYREYFNFILISLCSDFSSVKKLAYVGSDYCNETEKNIDINCRDLFQNCILAFF
jgi:hypothetical protein